MKNQNFILLIATALITVVVCISQFICPINELDGAWYFSQAASIINGHPFFNEFTQYNTPLLFGWVQAPVALVVKSQYSVVMFYALVIFLLGFLIAKNMYSQNLWWSLLIASLLISDKSILSQRPEVVVLMLSVLFWLRYRVLDTPSHKLTWGFLFAIILVALHPANGVLAIAGFLCAQQALVPQTLKRGAIFLVIGIVGLSIFFLMPENVFKSMLVYRLETYNLSVLVKFFSFSGITIAAFLLLLKTHLSREKVLNFLALFIVCSALGTSYYLVFLFIPLLIWTIENKEDMKWKPLAYLALGFNLALNVIHPNYVRIENSAYCNQIYKVHEEIAKHGGDNKVFLESYFATAQFFDNSNSRMILLDPIRTQPFDSIKSGDVVLMTNPRKCIQLEEYLNMGGKRFAQTADIKPVKGLLSIKSLYKSRSDSLGLWVYTIQ